MTTYFNANLLIACLSLFLLSSTTTDAIVPNSRVFDIRKYGAVGNGKTDCTKAVQKAWNEVCAVEGKQELLIPQGKYLVGPLMFKGPCKGIITVRLNGNLLGQPNHLLYPKNWIHFQYVNGFTIVGSGKIDGQGAQAWPHNQCPKKWECKTLPINLVFSYVNDVSINGISSINSKFFHMMIYKCNNMDIRKITIDAPENSPNTDGIHVAGSFNVSIADSTIGTGDDCVSVGDNTKKLTITGVKCGPGHGISVGSLGKNPGEGDVVGFTVKNCIMTGTMNGIRIKTWKSKPSTAHSSLRLTDFTIENIVMNNVQNPIVIDQEYCPYSACAESAPSRIKISHVAFRNIRGTYSSGESIKLVCSSALPCEGIELRDIDLKYIGNGAAQQTNAASSKSCANVKGLVKVNVKPDPCTGKVFH